MLILKDVYDLKDIYNFHLNFETPYFFNVDFENWKKSFTDDIDGEGRRLFKELNVKAVYDNDALTGFVHYGKTSFGFEVEHENVYYSFNLKNVENSEVTVNANNLTKGNQQYIDFRIDGNQIGGCEVHYLDNSTVFLRWIYVNSDITGKGIGTKCMTALKQYLYNKGIKRFDTDTAINNTVAQHYYEKNNFIREGITRSYYKK